MSIIALDNFQVDLLIQLQLINPSVSIPIDKKTKSDSKEISKEISKKNIISPVKELQKNIIVSLKKNHPELILPEQTFLLSLENNLLSQLFQDNNCSQILVSGKNKGNECSKKSKKNSLCTMHYKKSLLNV
jgi:hypothetical protein